MQKTNYQIVIIKVISAMTQQVQGALGTPTLDEVGVDKKEGTVFSGRKISHCKNWAYEDYNRFQTCKSFVQQKH